MAAEIRAYTLNIPVGATAAAPARLDVSFPPRVVDGVQVIVPPGPAGLVGWQIQNSGVKLIPYASDDWIVTAGEVITWPLTGQITSGSWQVAGYNLGTVSHSVYFRFLLSLVGVNTNRALPQTIDESLLSSDVPIISSAG